MKNENNFATLAEKLDKQDMIKYTRSFVDDIENSFNTEIEIEQDLDWSGAVSYTHLTLPTILLV